MQPFIVVKVGTTLPSLVSKKGDFEDWVLSGMKAGKNDAVVIDVCRGAPLPAYEDISGIVITGSHSMVTEHQEWSERTARWLAGAVSEGIPILGICYGHQLLAYAMGGEVGDNPNGREYGTVDIYLEPAASQDALLYGLSNPIQGHTGHTQTVLRLPEIAQRLAFSQRDRNQAFVIGTCAWGVQFHPEFDAEITREYIRSKEEILRAEGQDVQDLIAKSEDTFFSSEILRRFTAVIDRKAG